MDIAALSTQLAQVNLMQNVSLAVTNMAMDAQQQMSTDLVESLETSVPASHPTLGQTIDISV